MEILIVTGLSGAGKSKACSCLEDSGFYIVDNLPAEMLLKFSEFCVASNGKYEKVALVYDVRAGKDFQQFLSILKELKQLPCDTKMLYLECSNEVLIHRYKETRRMHPLAENGGNLEKAIALERKMTKDVKEQADFVLDTSGFTTGQLRAALARVFTKDGVKGGMVVSVMSFGFKHGIPLEADLVFDVRFMPNPYYVHELRDMTGLDQPVIDYVLSMEQSQRFVNKLEEFLQDLLPWYSEEGKTSLCIAIGCTGGHHRSIVMAQELGKHIESLGYTVNVIHRDKDK